MPRTSLFLAAAFLSLAACSSDPASEPTEVEPPTAGIEIVSDVEERLGWYAPVTLDADLSTLDESEREVLDLLIEASRPMSEIFLRQAWGGNPEMRQRLGAVSGPLADAARSYFEVNVGPWDRFEAFEPFLGDRARPEGGGHYPEDASREEIERWIAEHPEDAEAFRSLTTEIERRDGGLVAVPYSERYRSWLEASAAALRQAAARTKETTLSTFLEQRADAFASDDYYESDKAWMDLDSRVEVTIGPYETYEDQLFGWKAAFESFVTVVAPEDSRQLAGIKNELPWFERNLPIPDEHKNLDRGTDSPIRVADLVFAAGEATAGVQTIAFNLPNDERVREEKGSKKVILKNVLAAKYERILEPIAERTLIAEQAAQLSFDAFFQEVLHHELAHGLGPGKIEVDGRETEVRLELEELYSTIEEAKADVLGVYDLLALIDAGRLPAELRSALEPTYLAGLFRSARFGVHEAHGQGVVAQFNYLAAEGAVVVDEDGRYRVVSSAFPGAIEKLLAELLMLQATGDKEGTALFLDTWGQATQPLLAAIDRLGDVPRDIRPDYPLAH